MPTEIILLVISIVIITVIFRFIVPINIARKMAAQTEQESHEKMIRMQKNYILHILLTLFGIFLIWSDYSSNEVGISMSTIFGILMILVAVYGLTTRKKIIEMHADGINNPNPELYSVQKKVTITVFLLVIVTSYICNLYHFSPMTSLIAIFGVPVIPIIYFVYKRKQLKNTEPTQ